MTIAVEEVRLDYGAEPVIDGLSLDLPAGGITAILGPNGCGKSTLLRGMGRLLTPRSGRVRLDGRDIGQLSGRVLARRLAVLTQQPVAPDGITVRDLVSRGRHPHLGLFGRWSASDASAVDAALDRTQVADLAERPVSTLSGGQRQRVWIAMTLAQDTDVLLLDEPTTFLDVAHQLDVLDLLAVLHRDLGKTVVMVLHDLNLAARYAERLVVLAGGRIVADGAPAAVLTEQTVADAFGLAASVVPDPVTGTPLVVPLASEHRVR